MLAATMDSPVDNALRMRTHVWHNGPMLRMFRLSSVDTEDHPCAFKFAIVALARASRDLQGPFRDFHGFDQDPSPSQHPASRAVSGGSHSWKYSSPRPSQRSGS